MDSKLDRPHCDGFLDRDRMQPKAVRRLPAKVGAGSTGATGPISLELCGRVSPLNAKLPNN